jgi:phage tail tape-measure protein
LNKWEKELGIPVEKVQTAVGGLLAALRGALPQESYEEVKAELPESEESVAAFETTASEEIEETEPAEKKGSILGSLAGAVSRAASGTLKDSTAAYSALVSMGLNNEQVRWLAGKLQGALKGRVSPEIMAKIEKVLPVPEETTA